MKLRCASRGTLKRSASRISPAGLQNFRVKQLGNLYEL